MKTLIAACVAALMLAGAANAATIDQLPGLGYSVSSTALCSGFPCVATGCHDYTATGYGATADFGSDCDAGFQFALDSFVAGHDERKLAYEHPAAVNARASLEAKGYDVSTGYATPTFRVTGGCGVDSTVDSAGIVTLDAALATAAPCPPPPAQAPPPPTTTTTPTATTGGTTPTAPATDTTATTANPTVTVSFEGDQPPDVTVTTTTSPTGAKITTTTIGAKTPSDAVTVTLSTADGTRTLASALHRAVGLTVTIGPKTRYVLRGRKATKAQIIAALRKSHRVTIQGARAHGGFVATTISVR